MSEVYNFLMKSETIFAMTMNGLRPVGKMDIVFEEGAILYLLTRCQNYKRVSQSGDVQIFAMTYGNRERIMISGTVSKCNDNMLKKIIDESPTLREKFNRVELDQFVVLRMCVDDYEIH